MPAIKELSDWDPAVLAFWGLEGGIIEWNGIPVYPKGLEPYSTDIVAAHARHWGAPLVVSLIDAWVLPPMLPSLRENGVRWACWYMVDQDPLTLPVHQAISQADYRIAPSRYGQRVTQDAGLDCTYIPLGTDLDVYQPMPRREARAAVGIPEDCWLVGMVAANKCPHGRKAYPQAIEAFARFAKDHPDARLYIHTEVTPKHGGHNIQHLVQFFGVEDRVHFSDRYMNHLGFDDQLMRSVFSSFDYLLAPSLGEGFGVPLVEAQACGVPVITGAWTAMDELSQGPANVRLAVEDALPWWTPQGGYWHIPHPMALLAALEEAYSRPTPDPLAVRSEVVGYDVRAITERHWLPFLERVDGELAVPPPGDIVIEEVPA